LVQSCTDYTVSCTLTNKQQCNPENSIRFDSPLRIEAERKFREQTNQD